MDGFICISLPVLKLSEALLLPILLRLQLAADSVMLRLLLHFALAAQLS